MKGFVGRYGFLFCKVFVDCEDKGCGGGGVLSMLNGFVFVGLIGCVEVGVFVVKFLFNGIDDVCIGCNRFLGVFLLFFFNCIKVLIVFFKFLFMFFKIIVFLFLFVKFIFWSLVNFCFVFFILFGLVEKFMLNIVDFLF